MTTVLYVADPMCSWCWGFRPALDALTESLREGVTVRYVMGGLAPDSDEPMPEATRRYVQSAWDAVEARTGARFNRAFWTECVPRRSTYPACRAVLAAEALRPGAGRELFRAIQEAYYLEAMNPSESATLVELAGTIAGLDAECIRAAVDDTGSRLLARDLELCRTIGVAGFPTLAVEGDGGTRVVVHGYATPEEVLRRFEELLK